MQTLARALRQAEGIGEPLPAVFEAMAKKRWHFRRAQVVMVASAPNVGKSALALHLLKSWNMPALYFSADTDAFTTIVRAAAMLTGHSSEAVEAAFKTEAGSAYYEEILAGLGDVRFTFDPGPTIEDIDLEISAFNEIYGEPPRVIVLDNLMNVQADDGDEFRALRLLMAQIHQIARSTGACTIVLHHVTGEFEDGTEPPPRRALHGKVSNLPDLVLTLGKQASLFGIACVKNKTGPASPLADNAIWLHVDLDRMQFTEA